MFKDFFAILKPPENILNSEWVEQHRELTTSTAAIPGPIDISVFEYTRAVIDAPMNPLLRQITMMWGSQNSKTETVLSIMSRFQADDPCPTLVVLPTGSDAGTYSKERYDEMVDNTDVLRGRVIEQKAKGKVKSRGHDDTIASKKYPGGRTSFVGAHSPTGICARPIRLCVQDEVDRFPKSAGKEGDPSALADKRTTTFPDSSLIIKTSSPGVEGESRISPEYLKGTQEQYYIKCPKCTHQQQLIWQQVKYSTRKNEDGSKEVIPDSAHYECPECQAELSDMDINKAVRNGEWIAKYPERHYHRSFQISSLYSPMVSFFKLSCEWVNSEGDLELRKVFINTRLAELWVEPGEKVEDMPLYNRREKYNALEVLPEQVCYITAAVDTQKWGNAVEIKGWGRGEESWSLEQFLMNGDNSIMKGTPQNPSIWEDLEKILAERRYNHPSGVKLRIAAVAVDSGGHYTTEVYKFSMWPHPYRCHAIKGHYMQGAPLWPAKPSKNNAQNCQLWMVGVNNGKDMLHADLQKHEYGPGYCHFPDYPLEYFKQLTAEHRVSKKKNGVMITEWKQMRKRNEALDLHVYNRAVLEGQAKNLAVLSDDLGITDKHNPSVNVIIQQRKKKKVTSTKTYRRRRV